MVHSVRNACAEYWIHLGKRIVRPGVCLDLVCDSIEFAGCAVFITIAIELFGRANEFAV